MDDKRSGGAVTYKPADRFRCPECGAFPGSWCTWETEGLVGCHDERHLAALNAAGSTVGFAACEVAAAGRARKRRQERKEEALHRVVEDVAVLLLRRPGPHPTPEAHAAQALRSATSAERDRITQLAAKLVADLRPAEQELNQIAGEVAFSLRSLMALGAPLDVARKIERRVARAHIELAELVEIALAYVRLSAFNWPDGGGLEWIRPERSDSD